MRQLDMHLSMSAVRQAKTWPLALGPWLLALGPGPLAPGSDCTSSVCQSRHSLLEKMYNLEEAVADCLNADDPGSSPRRQVLPLRSDWLSSAAYNHSTAAATE